MTIFWYERVKFSIQGFSEVCNWLFFVSLGLSATVESETISYLSIKALVKRRAIPGPTMLLQ